MKNRLFYIVILFQAFLLALGAGIYFAAVNKTEAFADTLSGGEGLTRTAPQSLEELQEADGAQLDFWADSLEKFDGREFGYVTPARNQYNKSTCWAFAAVGAAEASVLREGINKNATKDNLDFDETIAAYTRHSRDGSQDPLFLTANDKYDYGRWNQGDNPVNAFAIMTQGYTLLPENSFHQSVDESIIKSKLTQSEYYVQSYQSIPDDINAIKRAVLQYGAVTFNYSAPSYTKYYSATQQPNHSSIIVGWDDNVKSSEFRPQQPKGDGAWIIKNSWGDSGFDKVNGTWCYYISYELPIGSFYCVDLAMREDYQNIYHYDGDVSNSLRRYAADTQAAIYEAKLSSPTRQEQLKAVMIYAAGDDLDVNVKIYKDLTVNPGNVNDKINKPDQGSPFAEANAHVRHSGMCTIDLEEPIDLDQGEYFSIVVSCKSQYGTSVPVNCAVDGNASVNDMTYYYYGGKWTSYKDSGYYADTSYVSLAARIRAITNTVDRKVPIGNNLEYARVEIANRLVYYAQNKQLLPEMQVYLDGQLLKEGQDYEVEVNDIYTPGMTEIKISGTGIYQGDRTTCFEVAKAPDPPNILRGAVDVYNDTENLYDVPIPQGWDWAVENQKLQTGTTYWPNSLKYVGEDRDFYQNITCGLYVNKIDQSPVPTDDILSASVEIVGEYVYTGGQIIPAVNITFGGKTLRNGIDYILTFRDNILAGSATVIISGNGRYFGQTMRSFEILPCDISSLPGLKLDSTSFVYDGKEKTPQISSDGGFGLLQGVDFDVEYKDNVFAGDGRAVIKGKGNYTGEKELAFTISRAEKPQVEKTTIHLDKQVEKLSDIPLPEGFVWCDGTAQVVGGKLTAKAVYVGGDAANYETTELSFEIIIGETDGTKGETGGTKGEADGDVAGKQDNRQTAIIWTAVGVTSAVLAASGLAFCMLRRRRGK